MLAILWLGCKKVYSFLYVREVFEGQIVEFDRRKYLKTVLFSIFVWNTTVTFLSVQTSRYHLIGVIPLMIAAAIGLEMDFEKNSNEVFKRFLFLAFSLVYLFVSSYSFYSAEKTYFTDSNSDVVELDHYLKQAGVETAVFIWDTSMSERMRLYDDTILYTAYLPSDQKLYLIDYYLRGSERSCLSDRNALVVKNNQSIDWVQDYIKNTYTEYGTVGEYTIYMSDVNRFDGLSGLEFGNYAVDYPYSVDYSYRGEINQDGILLTYGVEDYALVSPVYHNVKKKNYTITMQYYGGIYSGVIGQAELWHNGALLESKDIRAEEREVDLDVNRLQDCQLRINVDSDKSIAIQQFIFKEIEPESE